MRKFSILLLVLPISFLMSFHFENDSHIKKAGNKAEIFFADIPVRTVPYKDSANWDSGKWLSKDEIKKLSLVSVIGKYDKYRVDTSSDNGGYYKTKILYRLEISPMFYSIVICNANESEATNWLITYTKDLLMIDNLVVSSDDNVEGANYAYSLISKTGIVIYNCNCMDMQNPQETWSKYQITAKGYFKKISESNNNPF